MADSLFEQVLQKIIDFQNNKPPVNWDTFLSFIAGFFAAITVLQLFRLIVNLLDIPLKYPTYLYSGINPLSPVFHFLNFTEEFTIVILAINGILLISSIFLMYYMNLASLFWIIGILSTLIVSLSGLLGRFETILDALIVIVLATITLSTFTAIFLKHTKSSLVAIGVAIVMVKIMATPKMEEISVILLILFVAFLGVALKDAMKVSANLLKLLFVLSILASIIVILFSLAGGLLFLYLATVVGLQIIFGLAFIIFVGWILAETFHSVTNLKEPFKTITIISVLIGGSLWVAIISLQAFLALLTIVCLFILAYCTKLVLSQV